MAKKYKFACLIILILFIVRLYYHYSIIKSTEELEELEKSKIPLFTKIRITVYYEALCSDSRTFILNQLLPTYTKLHNYLELELVPYGKSVTNEEDGEYIFQCQHGPTECLANKIHACSLDVIKNSTEQLKYISCMIQDNLVPEEIAKTCTEDSKVPYHDITLCANGKKAAILLSKHGIRTNSVVPKITFIPTIEIDGEQKVPLVRILKNLKKELCDLFVTTPQECL